MFNRLVLIGNLTKDCEQKTGDGWMLATSAIAVSQKKGNGQEEVTFLDLTFWNKNAEIALQYLSKGRRVCVEGKLKMDSWQDKETGKQRVKHYMLVENIVMLDYKQDGNNQQPSYQNQNANQGGYNRGNQNYRANPNGYQPQQGFGQPNGGQNQYQQRPVQTPYANQQPQQTNNNLNGAAINEPYSPTNNQNRAPAQNTNQNSYQQPMPNSPQVGFSGNSAEFLDGDDPLF